jgi:hypothetical protein
LGHDLPLGHLEHCQLCASPDLALVLDLGHQAPCDSLLTAAQLQEAESTYPLRFVRCRRCGLAQIDYVVAPEVLFHPRYPYRSGITETLSRYLRGTAEAVATRFPLRSGALAVDVGSNDGTLLGGFKARGLRVLGVEPTEVAKIASENGIPTVQAFFGKEVARELREGEGRASVVTATNMFAHVRNLGELIQGVGDLLEADGVFVTESHYLLDLVETVQYDSIYHEHLKYYSLRHLVTLFEHHAFTVVDAERIPNYGGSLRVYATRGKHPKVSERVGALLQAEAAAGLFEADTYTAFRDRVVRARLELQALLLDFRRRGLRVVGVGCPGRASTLLNYCGVDRDLMAYIAEQPSSLKIGLFLPGKHLPVVDEKVMFEEGPDYAVMLSWHYAEPIMRKLRQRGLRSRFVVPLPEVRVVEG